MPRKKTEVTEEVKEEKKSLLEKAKEKVSGKGKKSAEKTKAPEEEAKANTDDKAKEKKPSEEKKSAKIKASEQSIFKDDKKSAPAGKKDNAKTESGGRGLTKDQRVINSFERQYRKEGGDSVSPAKRRKQTVLQRLEAFKKDAGDPSRVYKMVVDYADSESGDLAGTDIDGLDFVIEKEEVVKLFPKYIPYISGHLLGAEFRASIKEVSDDGVIFLTPVACSVNEKDFNSFLRRNTAGGEKRTQQQLLEATIREGIEKEQKPVLRGTAIRVDADAVYVDIFNAGIIAVVPRKHFSFRFHRDLRDMIQVGDSVRGVVFAYRAKEGSDEKHYIMNTRYHMADDSWKKASRFKKGDTILVRCVDIPDGTQANQLYFWGVSPLAPGIDILCDYTTKVPAKDVAVGTYYRCRIKDKNDRDKQLKVSPFEKATSRELERVVTAD
ncbi:MAG: hypothetical protein K6E75_06620 [Lachnospiraceae bacterium]|nr:hypothetical protein [Lachnospiraceae bacterium]